MSKFDKKLGIEKPKYRMFLDEEMPYRKRKKKVANKKADHEHEWKYVLQDDTFFTVYKKVCSLCGKEKLWAKIEF